MTTHVYLSPHLDDVVYSCGGLIAQQVSIGDEVTVLTICAGDPQPGELTVFARELHARWHEEREPIEARRAEDREACRYLGVNVHHLEIPEAIYRRAAEGGAFYPSEESIFGPLHASDAVLAEPLCGELKALIRPEDRLYAPLAVGGHVDHRLTRIAAEGLHRPLWYYQEMPYAARGGGIPEELGTPIAKEMVFSLRERELEVWVNASLRYQSQVSTFWANPGALRDEFKAHYEREGGLRMMMSSAVHPPS